MSDHRFVYVIFIESSLERVWQALTVGAFTRAYWAGRRIESDWQPGSSVKLFLEDTQEHEVAGEVIACEPPRRLSYTWQTASEADAPISTVTFELHPMGGSVRLTVIHEPLADDDMARQGWAAIMSSLKSYLEAGRPLSATEMWRQRAA
jgi:uncharacterized protein YndB with AHSA1/START domain